VADIVWSTEPDGRVVQDLPGWRSLTGQTLDQLLGYGWLDAVHPDDRERLLRFSQEMTDRSETELRVRDKTGRYRPLLSRAVRLLNPDSSTRQWVGIIIDLTEQERVQRALAVSEQRYRLLADALPQVVWVLNSRALIEYCNQYWLEYSGLTLEQTQRGEWISAVHPVDAQRAFELAQRCRNSGEPFEFEVRIRRAGSETYRWHLARASRYSDERGKRRWIATGTDIDDRKKAEENFSRIVQTAHEGIWTIDADLRTTFVNLRMAEMLGYELEELRNCSFLISHFPEDRERVMRRLEDRRNRQSEIFDQRLRKKDGSELWVRISASPLLDDVGRFAGVLRMFTDISDRKEAERELQRQADALARSNADLNEFAYAASHDLQEPLRMIGSYTKLLSRRYTGQLDTDGREFVDYILDGVTRMTRLINDLLKYSRAIRPDANAPSVVDLSEPLRAAMLNLELLIEESGAVIDYEPLPEVAVNSTQMAQVFQNLISNAIKYRSEQTPKIVVRAVKSENEWTIEIADNGIGIPAEQHERIFGMFKRLHGVHVAGTGIGLALCRRVIENHGGRIWVDSTPGKGSTFRFALPRITHGRATVP
jgi:PAS domain S-box-containing protein